MGRQGRGRVFLCGGGDFRWGGGRGGGVGGVAGEGGVLILRMAVVVWP